MKKIAIAHTALKTYTVPLGRIQEYNHPAPDKTAGQPGKGAMSDYVFTIYPSRDAMLKAVEKADKDHDVGQPVLKPLEKMLKKSSSDHSAAPTPTGQLSKRDEGIIQEYVKLDHGPLDVKLAEMSKGVDAVRRDIFRVSAYLSDRNLLHSQSVENPRLKEIIGIFANHYEEEMSGVEDALNKIAQHLRTIREDHHFYLKGVRELGLANGVKV